MKKTRYLSLLLIPTMLLVGCKGQKISEEKAKELANKITENTDKVEDASFECTVNMKGAEGKDKEKEDADVQYVLSISKDGNTKFKLKGYEGDKKYDYVIYIVKNEEYKEISYIKEYDQDKKTYNEYVYAEAINEDYSDLINPYTTNALLPFFFVAGYSDPVRLLESDDFKNGEFIEDELTYKREVTFYSNGEKNLTIESTSKCISKEIPEEEEQEVEVKYSITYDNLLLKKATMSGKSNYGNSTTIKLNLEFKDIKIELPDNWQDLLNK